LGALIDSNKAEFYHQLRKTSECPLNIKSIVLIIIKFFVLYLIISEILKIFLFLDLICGKNQINNTGQPVDSTNKNTLLLLLNKKRKRVSC